MNRKSLLIATAVFMVVTAVFAEDEERTAPFTAAELEGIYTANIEKRTGEILELLAIQDAAKAARVHDVIMAQYRSLRARDEAMDGMFAALSKNAPGIETNRGAILKTLSHQMHEHFLTRLSAELTPQQVEQVKDKMTYNKVKVTYDAYCQIVPNLTENEKAGILELLKAAREEAIDGGSADEKAAIFQKFKNQINATLNANGHDVAAATKEWESKQAAAKASVGN